MCSSPRCVWCVPCVAVYHALYLEELTAAELIRKMASVCNLPLGTINQVYRQGPTGIHILLSDQVHAPNVTCCSAAASPLTPKMHKIETCNNKLVMETHKRSDALVEVVSPQ